MSPPLHRLMTPAHTWTRVASSSFSSSSSRVVCRSTGQITIRSLASHATMPVPQKADITAEISGQANVDLLAKVSRDFRSDTFTMPTDAQMMAAMRATRGDDVYMEDDATSLLEKRIAKLAGKEAALFGMSGTMTNQLAIRTHMKQPPHSVLVDYRAHVHKMEGESYMYASGGIAMFTQATTDQVIPANGIHLTADDIRPNLQLGDNIHYRPTKLICLENTLNGMIFPQEEVVKIGQLVKEHDIGLHLDGARIWNVAAAAVDAKGLDPRKEEDLQTVLTELLEPFDSASLCLSKGIGAPIGSAIVGSKAFIDRARWFRKSFGGGVRQIGPMAAAADYAITHHFPRLTETHAMARRMGDALTELGCGILFPVDTNMVWFDVTPLGIDIKELNARLAALPQPITNRGERCVIHHQTSPQAVEDYIALVKEMKAEVDAGKTDLAEGLQEPPAVVGEGQTSKKYISAY